VAKPQPVKQPGVTGPAGPAGQPGQTGPGGVIQPGTLNDPIVQQWNAQHPSPYGPSQGTLANEHLYSKQNLLGSGSAQAMPAPVLQQYANQNASNSNVNVPGLVQHVTQLPQNPQLQLAH
jgi:hypothetical protein